MSDDPSPDDIGTNRAGRLSRRIEQRYSCRLETSLARWFDEGIYHRAGGNEFSRPVDPSVWLDGFADDSRRTLWPALMPCHFLPLIGNGDGDFLCVRCGDDGRMSQVVHWFHGGGDWIPWGDNLAQALLVDGWSDRLPGAAYRHADSSRVAARGATVRSDRRDDWVAFAADCLDVQTPTAETSRELASWFWDRGIGTAAVALGWLAEGFHRSAELGPPPTAPVQPPARDPFERSAGEPDRETIALESTRRHPALAWTWDSIGLHRERAGDRAGAVEAYDRGARCSVFTSQSVRMGTHGAEDDTPKFSIARMTALDESRVRGDDYFRRLTMRTHADRQNAVHSYWMSAAAAQVDGSPPQWFCLHMSAWDIGLATMKDYANVLRCIVDSTRMGGAAARAAVARVHLDVLERQCGSVT